MRHAIRHTSMLLTAFLVVAVCASAEAPISEQQISEMIQSGLDGSTVARMVESNGVAFPVTPETLIKLKGKGIPEAVLAAIAAVSARSKPTRPEEPALAAYKVGKFDEVVALVGPEAKDPKARVLIVMALARLDRLDEASVQADRLAAGNDEEQRLSVGVRDAIRRLSERKRANLELVAALDKLDAAKARSVVAGMNVTEPQRAVLSAYLLAFEGRFAEAAEVLGRMSTTTGAERLRLHELRKGLDAWRTEFEAVRGDIDKVLFSGATTSCCWGGVWTKYSGAAPSDLFPEYAIGHYVTLVDRASRLCPLDSTVMDLAVHAQLLGGSFESVVALANKVMQAKKVLRLPAFSKNQFLWLVLDANQEHLRLEIDPHAFSVQYTTRGLRTSRGPFREAPHCAREAVLFDLSFGAIKKLAQAHSWRDGGAGMGGRVLQLEPKGELPNFALNFPYYYAFGRKATEEVIVNFGRLVAHVVRGSNKGLTVALITPSEGKGGIGTALGAVALGTLGTVAGAYGGTAQQQILNQGAQDLLKTMGPSAEAKAGSLMGQAWQAEMVRRTNALATLELFEDLQQVLESR